MARKCKSPYWDRERPAVALGKKTPSWVSHHIDVPEMVEELREKGVVARQLTEYQVRHLKQLKPEERKRLIEKSEELPSSREIEEAADKKAEEWGFRKQVDSLRERQRNRGLMVDGRPPITPN